MHRLWLGVILVFKCGDPEMEKTRGKPLKSLVSPKLTVSDNSLKLTHVLYNLSPPGASSFICINCLYMYEHGLNMLTSLVCGICVV